MYEISKRKFRFTKKDAFYWLVLLLPVLQICIFYIYVNLNSILLSFKVYDDISTWHWDVTANFKAVFSDLSGYILKTSIKNSLFVFALMFVFGNLAALVMAYYFYKKKPLTKFFRVILFLPSIISSVVLVLIFKTIAEDGYVFLMKGLFGAERLGLLTNPDTRFTAIIVYSIVIGYGGNILLFSGAMSGVNESVAEAAELDGVGFVGEFFHVVLPYIWPTFVTLTAVSVAQIFVNQVNLYTLYGDVIPDYSMSTVGWFLFSKAHSNMISMSEYPYLAALGLFFTIIILPFPILIRHFMFKFGPSED